VTDDAERRETIRILRARERVMRAARDLAGEISRGGRGKRRDMLERELVDAANAYWTSPPSPPDEPA